GIEPLDRSLGVEEGQAIRNGLEDRLQLARARLGLYTRRMPLLQQGLALARGCLVLGHVRAADDPLAHAAVLLENRDAPHDQAAIHGLLAAKSVAGLVGGATANGIGPARTGGGPIVRVESREPAPLCCLVR